MTKKYRQLTIIWERRKSKDILVIQSMSVYNTETLTKRIMKRCNATTAKNYTWMKDMGKKMTTKEIYKIQLNIAKK